MSLNPYQAPQEPTAIGESDAHESVAPRSLAVEVFAYRTQANTVKWLVRLFVLVGFTDAVLLGIHLLNATTRLPDSWWIGIGDLTYAPFWLVYSAFGVLQVPALLASVVLYGIWVRRANVNARAIGAKNMQFTPGWCIGWFFVPMANFFLPYQAVREIYQTSSPAANATGWEKLPGTLVWWWWAAWLLANFASQTELNVFYHETDDQLYAMIASWFGVLTRSLWLVASYLAAKVVMSISRRQEDKWAAMNDQQNESAASPQLQ